MARFFWKKLPRLALGAVVVLVGVQGELGAARTNTDPKGLGWLMSLREVSEGVYRFEAAAGDLRVTNTRMRMGEVDISITAGVDTIALGLNAAGVTVTSRGRSATLGITAVNAESAKAVQALVRDSKAVRKFHARMSQHPQNEQQGLYMGLAVTHALLRTLEGDYLAPRRLFPYLLSSPAGGVIRIQTRRRCFGSYEEEVVRAWDDYAACLDELPWYVRHSGGGGACAFRWAVWVSGAWFEFLGCSTVPLPK